MLTDFFCCERPTDSLLLHSVDVDICSGGGKSTILNVLLGQTEATSGSVVLHEGGSCTLGYCSQVG